MRRGREWGNQDMYHPAHGVHAPRPTPQFSRGDGVRSFSSHRFARRVPSHAQYDDGQRTHGFGSQRYDEPCFPYCGDRRPKMRREMSDNANPTVEQMAQHWFATHFSNPSVESFAHSSHHF